MVKVENLRFDKMKNNSKSNPKSKHWHEKGEDKVSFYIYIVKQK